MVVEIIIVGSLQYIKNHHWKSIQDGDGRHFEFRFGAIIWVSINIFAPNLVQWWKINSVSDTWYGMV